MKGRSLSRPIFKMPWPGRSVSGPLRDWPARYGTHFDLAIWSFWKESKKKGEEEEKKRGRGSPEGAGKDPEASGGGDHCPDLHCRSLLLGPSGKEARPGGKEAKRNRVEIRRTRDLFDSHLTHASISQSWSLKTTHRPGRP